MDRLNIRVQVNEASVHHTGIQEIIKGLIAQRGYHSVIVDLVAAVQVLADNLLADPEDRAKQRHFSLWAGALRDTIQRHSDESTFERRVTDMDRIAVRAMGIKLD